ncbi:MAG TPA: alginate export family protein [bacterium]|nr:alginate export family protein [bacterium]HPJ71310.1 alginate export family protein [bacterium]HPQ65432.1 alginate export family protein [bacterium]
MRKYLVAALALAVAFSMTTALWAEVQNVRLGGDIRIRSYYTKNLNSVDSEDDHDDFYFRQLSRISSEADLTENVWAVATVEANGYWGQDLAFGGTKFKNDWDVNLAEAYIQLGEMFYSPVSFKAGRQYLNYGNGFLISSREWYYKFDAARLIFDFAPWTIDLVYSRLVESDWIPGVADAGDDEDLFGMNLTYVADLWTVEGYVFGIRDAYDEDYGTDKNAPIAIGARFDASPLEAFDVWAEFVYELGTYQADPLSDQQDYAAYGLDAGMVYVFDVAWEPALALSYTMGSGGKADDDKYKFFDPFFNYNYYGYAYSPYLSNIGILNAQISFLPSESMTLIGSFYYYAQMEKAMMVMGNPDMDNGGVDALTNGNDDYLGVEFDAILEYDYTEDVSAQLIGAWFKPGDAYEVVGNDNSPDDVFELRAELFLSF